MDAHQVGCHKVPTIITADSLIAGASSGSPGHETGGLLVSSALASAPTVYQGVVIKRLECTQLSASPPVSDSPVGTVAGRCSSTSSCSGDGGSSSNTGLETAADATHLRHNRQGMHTAGTGAGDRAQQAHTDTSQQQQRQQQQREVAPAKAPILPRPGLQLPRPPLPAGSSKGPVPDLNNLQPSCYIQRRRMLAQARQRMHATAPERLVGLALPPATYTATNFNQLVTHAGDAAAPAAAAAAAGTSVAATGGRDASRAEEDRDGASPPRKRRAYNTRCKTPKPAAAAASSAPAPAAPVPVRKGRRAATPRPSPPAAAAAAAAVPGPAAAAALGVSQQPQRQAAPPVALPAPASAPVGLGAMGSVYADMEPPALAMSGTIITAAALVSPPIPSPVTAAGAALGAAAGAGMDVAAGPYQPMDMCSSGAACFTSQEPSILALGGDVLALGVYEPVTGAWGDTGGHSQQCLGHQLPALATWDCLPSAAAAAAAGGGGAARLSAPAAAAAARGPAAAPMGWVEQLGGSLTGWDSGAGAAPQQLPAQALQRNSSSLSSSSALWLDKDPSPRPDNTHLPSQSPPPFFAAAAAAGVGAHAAGASWYAPAGLLCGIAAVADSSSRPVVDVSGVMNSVWGEEEEGSLDAVLDMLVEGGMEEVGSGAGHTWLEGWEQELLL